PPGSRYCARADRSRRSSCEDRKSTRLNSSHDQISYAVFCLKKKKEIGDGLADEREEVSEIYQAAIVAHLFERAEVALEAGWHESLFFFNDTATTEIYTLSLHDALPI